MEMGLECRRQRPRPARGDCGPGSEHPTSLCLSILARRNMPSCSACRLQPDSWGPLRHPIPTKHLRPLPPIWGGLAGTGALRAPRDQGAFFEHARGWLAGPVFCASVYRFLPSVPCPLLYCPPSLLSCIYCPMFPCLLFSCLFCLASCIYCPLCPAAGALPLAFGAPVDGFLHNVSCPMFLVLTASCPLCLVPTGSCPLSPVSCFHV